MELSLESDAEALWQDSLDLLTGEGAPAALLAMLQKCSPVQLEDGVLHVETPMRMVANRRFQAELLPKKKQLRIDPYDNQSGEIERVHAEVPFTGRYVDTDMVMVRFEKVERGRE